METPITGPKRLFSINFSNLSFQKFGGVFQNLDVASIFRISRTNHTAIKTKIYTIS